MEELSKIETIEIEKTETRTDLEKKEEKTSEEKIEALIKTEIAKQETVVTTGASKIEKTEIIGKTAEELSKTEIIEIEKTEIKTDLEKKEEKTSEEKIEALIKTEIIKQEIIVTTGASKIGIEIIKVQEETSETDKIIEDFLIEADLIRTEMTLEETAEIFLTLKRNQHLKFQHRQWLKKVKPVEKEKVNSTRKNMKKIEETENIKKKNFVLTSEKMTKRKRKIRNRKKLSRMKLSELKERA